MYRFHLEPFSRPPPTQDPREHRVALVSHPVLSRDAPPILPIFAIVMPSKKKNVKCEKELGKRMPSLTPSPARQAGTGWTLVCERLEMEVELPAVSDRKKE